MKRPASPKALGYFLIGLGGLFWLLGSLGLLYSLPYLSSQWWGLLLIPVLPFFYLMSILASYLGTGVWLEGSPKAFAQYFGLALCIWGGYKLLRKKQHLTAQSGGQPNADAGSQSSQSP